MIFSLQDAREQHHHSPKLAEGLAEILPKEKTVIDFGCGTGFYICELAKKGFEVYGIEGTPGIAEIAHHSPIHQADISQPMEMIKYGSVICLEVIEHIPKEFEVQVLDNLHRHCDGKLIISWAVNGQGGHGHVNEQDQSYVLPTITNLGYELNVYETNMLRYMGGSQLWWFGKSIYVFDKLK